MGQQQILLIVLGVIMVGVALSVGLQQFIVGSESLNRDAIVNDIISIVGDAQTYYTRPNSFGGGNSSFTGYTIPTRLSETGNGKYEATGNENELIIDGISQIHNRVMVKLTLSRTESDWDYHWLWEHEGL
jgi:hypothetical protein